MLHSTDSINHIILNMDATAKTIVSLNSSRCTANFDRLRLRNPCRWTVSVLLKLILVTHIGVGKAFTNYSRVFSNRRGSTRADLCRIELAIVDVFAPLTRKISFLIHELLLLITHHFLAEFSAKWRTTRLSIVRNAATILWGLLYRQWLILKVGHVGLARVWHRLPIVSRLRHHFLDAAVLRCPLVISR